MGLWQRRYFMTHGHYLLYFGDKSKKKTLAAIDLLRVKLHTPTPAALKVRNARSLPNRCTALCLDHRLFWSFRLADLERCGHVLPAGER